MLVSPSLQHDLIVMAGTAIAGGQILDLQRRIAARRSILTGLPLIALGWSLLLAMAKAGPFPNAVGFSVGTGIALTGLALVAPPLFRAIRIAGDSDRRSRDVRHGPRKD